MHGKDIVVIGASSGGIEAIRTIAAGLPADFRSSVFVVLHTAPDAPGVLDVIFGGAGPLPAVTPESGERFSPGTIYVAKPDHHLIIEPGRVCLTRGPKENRFRPAVDPLFRSAAQTYGPRVVGVILTGSLDDGVAGLSVIKKLGGTTIVQDPADALAPSMPESAIANVPVDHIVRAAEIAPLLVRLASMQADSAEGGSMPEDIDIEVSIAKEDRATEAGVLKLGEPSNYACPECHGVLLRLKEHSPLRFRCHTGHAYTLESLLSEMDESIEDALWTSIRALEEQGMLMRHAAEHARETRKGEERDLIARAHESERRAGLVRQAAMSHAQTETKAARR